MSWDLIAIDIPPEFKCVADIPKGFMPSPIGKRSKVVERIKGIIPTADFSDPSWGLIDGEDWSIEVNLGKNHECKSFAFHVRGGDAAVGVVAAILQGLNLRAFDCQTGEFFVAGDEAIESFQRWRKYRDRFVTSSNK